MNKDSCSCGHHSTICVHCNGGITMNVTESTVIKEDCNPDNDDGEDRYCGEEQASGCGSGGCSCSSTEPISKSELKKQLIFQLTALLLLFAGIILNSYYSALNLPYITVLLVFFIAYLASGHEVLLSAGKNILKGHPFDENFLMSLASICAFAIGEMTEAVAVMIFYGVGELLQGYAVARSRSDISSLVDIRPDHAGRKTLDGIVNVSPEQISVGETIVVRPGEKVPLDGVVTYGESFLDLKVLSGESVPKRVTVGDNILSGSINTDGLLEVEVTKLYGESTVAKILELIQNASEKKAKSEKFITKFARYYTPIVVIVAIFVAVLPPLLGFGEFYDWLYRALSFLIISCPCALVISIPIGFFGGIGGAASNGVLVKGGNLLEGLNKIDTVVFDKTGTLTEGVFEVTDIVPQHGYSEEFLLTLAASAEMYSTHPIATSITEKYKGSLLQLENISEKPGFGVTADYNGQLLKVGSAKLIDVENSKAIGTAVHLSLDDAYVGYIMISDRIKGTAKQAISELRTLGINRIIMLTGDNRDTANEVSRQLGIDSCYSELLPGDKVDRLEEVLASAHGGVAFVGDGVNDAPVLTRADIGFAMGGVGSDAAIEAADVVIMNDDISKVATALKVARKTHNIVIQNIVFALGVKLAIMLLSFFGIASIWFAIFADVGVALLALLNAVRAMKISKN